MVIGIYFQTNVSPILPGNSKPVKNARKKWGEINLS
jgi:hypothetical protein